MAKRKHGITILFINFFSSQLNAACFLFFSKVKFYIQLLVFYNKPNNSVSQKLNFIYNYYKPNNSVFQKLNFIYNYYKPNNSVKACMTVH